MPLSVPEMFNGLHFQKEEKTNPNGANGGRNKSPVALAYVVPIAVPFDVAVQRDVLSVNAGS